MDQSSGTRGAAPGTFEVVRNCRVKNGGLQKRCGSSALTGTMVDHSGTTYAISDTASGDARPAEHPAFLGKLREQKLAGTSAGDVFYYGTTAWELAGVVSAAQPVRKRLGISPSLPTTPQGPHMPAAAVTSDGYVCTAAGFGAELRITVEGPNGDLLLAHTALVGAANIVVRAVVVGSTFYVLYQGTGGTTVAAQTISIVNGAVFVNTNTASVVTLANAASTWDASSYDGTNWFLVYQSGATTVTIAKMAALTASATATFSSTDNLTYLSVWADTTTARVWVGLVDNPTVAASVTTAFRVYTTSPTLSLGPTTLMSGVLSGTPLIGPLYKRSPAAGDAFCLFTLDDGALGAGLTPLTLQVCNIVGGVVGINTGKCFNVVPISKPDLQQRVWCMTYAPTSNFATAQVLLLRFEDADRQGTIGGPTPIVELASPAMETPGSTHHPAAKPGLAFHAVSVTTESAGGSAFFALPLVLTSRTNASGATEPTTRVETYQYTRWNHAPHQMFVPSSGVAVISGQPTELFGLPSQLNGAPYATGAVEIGFAHGPSIIASTVTPNGSAIPAGDYSWVAVQQWIDDQGNRHLSPPSEPYTLTLSAASSVLLRITNCYAGQRPDAARDISVASPTTLLYRTQNGGTEWQQVPVATVEPSANWDGYVSATDTVADTVIDDNEFLYTAGGVLPNVLAPSCRYIAVSEERLWCGGLWDSSIIECSKIRVPGEPYNFTGDPSHQVVIPGEVSGLAYMDGQLAVFTEDAIYLVAGDGPNDQGAGGFAPPRALVRGVGCPREQSASILETEIGILFRSKMGFYLIPRGYGSPEHIGEKVHNEDSIVLSAATTTTSEYRLAHFLVCASGETKSDTVLTLDLTSGQWFRDTYTVDGSITGQGFSEIGEWPDGLALMSYGLQRTDNLNIIWAHDEDLTGDAGAAGAGATTYISQYVRTNWIQLMGPAGLMRLAEVVLSAEPVGSSSLVSLTVETDANSDQTLSWTLTTSQEVSYRSVAVSEPQCTEFRVTIQDAAGASNSAGVRFLALGFATDPIPGIRRGTDSEGG